MDLNNKGSVVKWTMLATMLGVLSGCGGGGGGGAAPGGPGIPGGPTADQPFNLTLTTDKDDRSLAQNIAGADPVAGGPYTAVLNVRGNYVPAAGDGGNCWVADFSVVSGSASVALYKGGFEVNGESSFLSSYTDVSSSGNWNVMVHAKDINGMATVEVAVPDPNTSVVTCNDEKIEIGPRYPNRAMSYVRQSIQFGVGQATGKTSQIRVSASAPEYLFAQNSALQTQLLIQAEVLDDAGQRVPNPAATSNNLYARIVPTESLADDDAKLRGTGQADNTWVKARSINGQAQFALISGMQTGSVLIEVVGDRADNNIDNGIQRAITNYFRVDVVDESVLATPAVPPAIASSGTLPAGVVGSIYEPVVLEATDGLPPYKWSVVQGSLPRGIALQPYGVLQGVPLESGSFSFVAKVEDGNGLTAEAVFGLRIEPAPVPEPEPVPEVAELAIEGASALTAAQVNIPYAYAFSAVGGQEGTAYQWSASFRKGGAAVSSTALGLAMSAAGGLEGTPLIGMEGVYVVDVTVRRGSSVANRAFTLTVAP